MARKAPFSTLRGLNPVDRTWGPVSAAWQPFVPKGGTSESSATTTGGLSTRPSSLPASAFDPCHSADLWPDASTFEQLWPAGSGAFGKYSGGSWLPYTENRLAIIPEWANEFSADEATVVQVSMSLLANNLMFLGRGNAINLPPGTPGSGLAQLFTILVNTLGAAFPAETAQLLTGVAAALNAACDRITGTFPSYYTAPSDYFADGQPSDPGQQIRSVSRAGDLDPSGAFGYIGPIVIGKASGSNSWAKLVWAEDPSNTTPLQDFIGGPTAPDAYVYPLNWPYAVSNGFANPAAGLLTDGFKLDSDTRKTLTKISSALSSGGLLAEEVNSLLPLTALFGPWGIFLGIFLAEDTAQIASFVRDAGESGIAANDALANLVRAATGFLASNEPIARTYSAMRAAYATLSVVIVDVMNVIIRRFGGTALSPPAAWPAWPTTNALTGLTELEMAALSATLRTTFLGQVAPSLSGDALVVGMLEDAENPVLRPCLPIIHLQPCAVDFRFSFFEEHKADPSRPTREFAAVLETASLLLEQCLVIDDAVLAVSGQLLNGGGLLSAVVSSKILADGTNTDTLRCLDEATGGITLQRLVRILWKIDVLDTLMPIVTKNTPSGVECVEAVLCSIATEEKRRDIDSVIGPKRANVVFPMLDDLTARIDDAVVSARVFRYRYFVRGLLFRLLADPDGFCVAWCNLTCEERATVQRFFSDQNACCVCQNV